MGEFAIKVPIIVRLQVPMPELGKREIIDNQAWLTFRSTVSRKPPGLRLKSIGKQVENYKIFKKGSACNGAAFLLFKAVWLKDFH